MQLTKDQFIDLAVDLGRFCRSDEHVRAAMREDGSVYAMPGDPRSDYADDTLANFDFAQESAADGEMSVRKFLQSIEIVEGDD